MRMQSIRVAIILSLILVLMLTYVFLQLREEGKNMRSDDPRVWDNVIAAFEANDKTHAPPQNAVLFLGDSSIRLWDTLGNDMQPLTVFSRGFGGAKIIDLSYYVNRIVSPYQPTAIVVYIGSNDFTTAYGNTAKTLAQVKPLYLQLLDRLNGAAPDARLFIVALKPTIQNWANWPSLIEANQFLQSLAAQRDNVFFVDANAGLLTAEAVPDADLLLSDGRHHNDQGYQVWGAAIKALLMDAL